MMRWSGGGDDSPAARRAAELLRKLPAPAALTPRQLSDIEARLQQPAPRRARLLPWTLGLGAIAAIAAIIIFIFVTQRTTPTRHLPSAQRTIVLPQCGDVALDLPGVTLTGPGSATVEPDHIILSAGRLHIAASPRSLTITAPDAQITMSPGSAADIRVHDARTIVAALTGQIAVQWTSSRTLTQLLPGTSLSDSGPATLPPAHCEATPVPSPSPSVSPAGVGPSPTVVPEPLPSPTLAAPARRAPPPTPAPIPAPAPVPTPVSSAPPSASPSPAAPAAAAESPLGAEARLLSTALLRLRAHDAAGALSILDDYDARFPRGQLAVEASRLRAAVRSLPAASPRDE